MTNLLKNLKWGLRYGLIVAVAFTVIAAVITLATGEDSSSKGLSLPSLIGFYFLGGMCGGLLVGLLRPITKHKAGAILVGTLVTATLLSLMVYFYIAKGHWTSVDTELVAILSVIAGPVNALMIWEGKSRMRKAEASQGETTESRLENKPRT
jgi:peptidoglycan/LPS O-acetylase OafA/YrhL